LTSTNINLPITLGKQRNLRGRPKWQVWLDWLATATTVVAMLAFFVFGNQRDLLRSLTMAMLSFGVISQFYLPRFLSYELREEGLFLRSMLRGRTIPYTDIELATLFPAISSLGYGFGAFQSHGYQVGLRSSEQFGWVDVVGSSPVGEAVVLLLKKGRPVIFTPEHPERIVEMLDTLRRAAQTQVRRNRV